MLQKIKHFATLTNVTKSDIDNIIQKMLLKLNKVDQPQYLLIRMLP